MARDTGYTPEEKAAFIHGYAYAKAEEMKKSGNFKDMTIDDLTRIIIAEAANQVVKPKEVGVCR